MKTEKLKELLSYSRREKNGIIVLMVFVILIGSINLALPFLLNKPPIQIESLHIDWGELQENQVDSSEKKTSPYFDSFEKEYTETSTFGGDPGISKPFETSNYAKKEAFSGVIEINTADTAQLMQLKGVGGYFAKKIIKYRDRLGGFFNISQIKEIYNFPVELADQIAPQLSFNQALVKKIDINSVVDTVLDNHPYISRIEAKTLVAYRSKHGNFGNCDDLLKSITIKKEVSDRLCPYLVFD
jgi:DNA uptake protein ComE-like DNA-binding protein